MIRKGIIEKVISEYSYLIRIPVYHKIKSAAIFTPTEELPTATVCVTAGNAPKYRENDIVFVTFEDDDIGKPIILGLLYREDMPTTANNNALSSLEVSVNAKLSEDTSIGDVSGNEISQLSGIKDNIQWQIDKLVSTTEDLSNIRNNEILQYKIETSIIDLTPDVSDLETNTLYFVYDISGTGYDINNGILTIINVNYTENSGVITIE